MRIPASLKNGPTPMKVQSSCFVLAGHRNMEGERAFVQELNDALRTDQEAIAFKFSIGGGYKVSNGWEPLGPSRILRHIWSGVEFWQLTHEQRHQEHSNREVYS